MRLITGLLALIINISGAQAKTCLGEVQLLAKTGEVRTQEESCLVFPSLADQIVHETNPNCPGLSIDDILATGITVPLSPNGSCPYQKDEGLTGYVLLLENGTLIIQ